MDKKLVRVGNICVDCEENDPVDINCGGPQYLGFDFNVSIEQLRELRDFIEEEIKKAGLPLIAIYVSDNENYIPEEKVWTKEKISGCIKIGY